MINLLALNKENMDLINNKKQKQLCLIIFWLFIFIGSILILVSLLPLEWAVDGYHHASGLVALNFGSLVTGIIFILIGTIGFFIYGLMSVLNSNKFNEYPNMTHKTENFYQRREL